MKNLSVQDLSKCLSKSCSSLTHDEASGGESEYIDHKKIHNQAIQAAAIYREDEFVWVCEAEVVDYTNRIARTGVPGPHVKNIGRWFYKAFLRDARQTRDMAAHSQKKIGKFGMRIVSDAVLNSRIRQLATQKKNVEKQEIYCVRQGVEVRIALSEIWNTAEKRAAKHYVRTIGLEKYCRAQGLSGYFLTTTLPSKFHSNPSIGRNSWAGLTPRDGHDEMQNRSRNFQRRFGKTIGVRVEEQHSDGCIHWHSLIWIEQSRAEKMSKLMERYFGAAPATKIVPIDLAKGSAATYLMKYLFKATGAQYANIDEVTSDTTSLADAHRATWGGRGVEIFDIPGSSTMWDEFRRIKIGSKQYEQLIDDGRDLHESALNNDYCKFLLKLNEINFNGKRTCKIFYEKLETGTSVLKGLVVGDELITTHEKTWKIREKRKSEADTYA